MAACVVPPWSGVEMAAVAGTRRRPQPSLLARFAAKARTVTTLAARRLVTPHRAVLRNLADIPLTVAGFAAGDVAAWMWHPVVGVACLMPLLIALEHLIADER